MTSLGIMVVHIFHPYTQVTKYLRFIGGDRFYQFTALPFSIPTVFSRVHHGSKRGEADGSCRRHQYSPVYRRLANKNKLKTAMSREHPLVSSSCRKPRLDHKFLKLRFISNSRNRIFDYKFDLRVGLVFPTQKEIDRLLGRTFTMLKASHSSPGKLMSL